MMFSKKIPSEELKKIAIRVNKIIPKLLLELCKLQEDNIRKRTLNGVDLYGMQFKPYNEKYAVWKYRVVGHLDWLRLTGEMMKSMVARIKSPTRADIVIGSGSVHSSKQMNQLAGWHNYGTIGRGGSIPARSFWGFTAEDERSLFSRGTAIIRKAIHNVA